MSALLYGTVTRKRDEAPRGKSTDAAAPGVKTYVDSLAALVPAEVLLIHGLVLEATTDTKKVGGKAVTTITDPQTLKDVLDRHPAERGPVRRRTAGLQEGQLGRVGLRARSDPRARVRALDDPAEDHRVRRAGAGQAVERRPAADRADRGGRAGRRRGAARHQGRQGRGAARNKGEQGTAEPGRLARADQVRHRLPPVVADARLVGVGDPAVQIHA